MLQLQVLVERQAVEVVAEAEHQSKQRSTSKLLIQQIQQRFIQNQSALKSIHAPCLHNSWAQDVQEQMVASIFWLQMEKFLFESLN